MAKHVDLDDVWRKLGTFGKYQRIQAGLLMTTLVPEAIQLMVVVFIGYRPGHRCADISNSSLDNTGITLSYQECHIDVYNGTNSTVLSPCPAGYTYELEKDRTFVTEWDLVCRGAERAELSQMLLTVGMAIGAITLPPLSDRYGRKLVVVTSHIGMFAAAIGGCFLPTFTGFAIMRLLIGAFQQGLAMARPALLIELFPRELRYRTEVVGLTCWTTGGILITPVAYFLQDISWRYLYLILSLSSAYSLLGYWIHDESVRWLLANGKIVRAKEILRKAARMNKVNEDEILQIVDEAFPLEVKLNPGDQLPQENDSTKDKRDIASEEISMIPSGETQQHNLPKYTLFTLFKRRRIAIITLVMTFTWTVDSLTYYGLILSSGSLPVDRFLSYLLLAVAEYPVPVFEFLLMNRIGRKRFCILFHVIAAASLIAGTIANYFSESPGANTALMIFFFIGKLGITGSFSSIFLYTPELYPTNLRTVGMGFASATGRIGGMLAPFAGPLAERVRWAPGAIFGVLCLCVSLALTVLPETKGHELPTTVEELDQWYRHHSGIGKGKRRIEKSTASKS